MQQFNCRLYIGRMFLHRLGVDWSSNACLVGVLVKAWVRYLLKAFRCQIQYLDIKE